MNNDKWLCTITILQRPEGYYRVNIAGTIEYPLEEQNKIVNSIARAFKDSLPNDTAPTEPQDT